MGYIYDTTIAADTLEAMKSQFKGKDNITAVIEIFADQAQEIEDVLNQLATLRNIPNATGDQLDLIGEIVGEDRNGRNDTDYRAAIFIKASVNSADGTKENIIAVLSELTSSSTIYVLDDYPAKIQIYIDAVTIPASTVATVLAIKAGGVGLLGGVIYQYGFMLTEGGDYLVTEDGDKILIEIPF